MTDLNTFLLRAIYQGAGQWPVLDRFFILLTSEITYVVLILVPLYMLFVSPFRTADAKERLRRFAEGIQVLLALFLTWVSVWVLKILIAHPRPFVSIPEIVPLVNESPLRSFPSAHAAFTMALAIAVLPYRKQLGHILIAFSFVVALSRLYVGVHYPFDIGVGLLIGFCISKVITRIFKRK